MNSKWILWTGHKYSSTAASSGDRKCGKGGEGALKVPCSWGALGSRQTHVRLIRIGRLSEVDLPETFIPPLLWDASIFSSIRGFFFSPILHIHHTAHLQDCNWRLGLCLSKRPKTEYAAARVGQSLVPSSVFRSAHLQYYTSRSHQTCDPSNHSGTASVQPLSRDVRVTIETGLLFSNCMQLESRTRKTFVEKLQRY